MGMAKRILADAEARTKGRKCVALPDPEGTGRGVWKHCSEWEYSMDADFSSPAFNASSGLGTSDFAVCVLGAPRNVLDTFGPIRKKVVEVVKGDVFAYVPFADKLTRDLEIRLHALGPIVTAIAVPDVDSTGLIQRLYSEFAHPKLAALFIRAQGPWRAPLYNQMGSSMWGYMHQSICGKMVRSHEAARGEEYKWVIFARADILWDMPHPPPHVLDNRYVYVPFGQDNSFYNYGVEPGLNDRHAVIPRHHMQDYLGRWDDLGTGEAWGYLRGVAAGRHQINTEQYLLLHLRARGVRVRRFPPVAFIVHCSEGPQCQHLYKGTNLGAQLWMQTAKYHSELLEVRREVKDVLSGRHLDRWIWHQLTPPTVAHVDVGKPWEKFGLALVCCTTKSGPVSSRWWDLMKRCQCLREQ